jgi:hypothetical protein
MRLAYKAKIILVVVIGLGTLAVAYYMGVEKGKRMSLSLTPTQTVLPAPSTTISTTLNSTSTTLAKNVPSNILAFLDENKTGTIEAILPYDFEGDGRQEYIVEERIPGSAGVLYWYILFEENMHVQKIEAPSVYRNISTGRLRGHNSITITKEGLIKETAPVYSDKDPDCCPSEGETIFYFSFKKNNLNIINTGT